MKTSPNFPSRLVNIMRPILATATLLAAAALLFGQPAQAQYGQQQRTEFTIKKVETGYPSSPDLPGSSADIRWKPLQWLKVEVSFDAAPEFTEELTFNYYVCIMDKNVPRLFVGRVSHVNIFKSQPGQPLHSVIYMSPKTIQRILQSGNKPFVASSFNSTIAQIAVTINRPGISAPIAVGQLNTKYQVGWWEQMKQEEGFLVKKSETPFAPFFWDYYETEKPAGGRY